MDEAYAVNIGILVRKILVCVSKKNDPPKVLKTRCCVRIVD